MPAGYARPDQYVRFPGQAQAIEPHSPLIRRVIWVDDQDLVIVKSFGKFVSEIAGNERSFPHHV